VNLLFPELIQGVDDVKKIKCFLLTETDQRNLYIRRYSKLNGCSSSKSITHNKTQLLAKGDKKSLESFETTSDHLPEVCDCGYIFTKEDPVVTSLIPLYHRSDKDGLVELREAESGAMWYSDFHPWKGPDRKSLAVRTPGGDWLVDMPASNCAKKDDKAHKCWVRHGRPPEITVDKNGCTCSAGAGSIQIRGYHGFLRDGYLVSC